MDQIKWAQQRENNLQLKQKLSNTSELSNILYRTYKLRNFVFSPRDKKLADRLGDNYKYYQHQLENLLKKIFEEISPLSVDSNSENYSFTIKDVGEVRQAEDSRMDKSLEEPNSDELEISTGKQDFLDPVIMNCIYEACAFIGIAMFLYSSKRIKAKSENEFIRSNSPRGDSSNGDYYSAVDVEGPALRKYKNRELSRKPVYIKDNEWRFMPADSEHEWRLYYELDQGKQDKVLCDTFKRLRNLMKDIEKVSKYRNLEAISTVSFDELKSELDSALQKYLSKLNKIKYQNYFNLIKFILDHLDLDKEYYGNNIYRLEKEFCPYILSHQINYVINNGMDDLFAGKVVALYPIEYPKLYDRLFELNDLSMIGFYVNLFISIRNEFVLMAYYLLDEQVQDEPEAWIQFLKENINSRVESVFYSRDEIKLNEEEHAQKAFVDCMSLPVRLEIGSLEALAKIVSDAFSPGSKE